MITRLVHLSCFALMLLRAMPFLHHPEPDECCDHGAVVSLALQPFATSYLDENDCHAKDCEGCGQCLQVFLMLSSGSVALNDPIRAALPASSQLSPFTRITLSACRGPPSQDLHPLS